MKKCSKCGADINDDAKFCPYCGANQAAASKRFCESCGKEIVPGAKFCSGCGAEIKEQSNQQTQPNQSAQKLSDDEKTLNLLKLGGVNIQGTTIVGFSDHFKAVTKIFPVPKCIERIGDSAFRGWKNLENVVFEEGVVSIGAHAFEDCDNLRIIELPKTLTKVGYAAFRCPNLTYVTFNSISVPYFEDTSSLFGKSITNPNFKIYVPKLALNDYKNVQAPMWQAFVVEHLVGI